MEGAAMGNFKRIPFSELAERHSHSNLPEASAFQSWLKVRALGNWPKDSAVLCRAAEGKR
jgi:hypothetical protein